MLFRYTKVSHKKLDKKCKHFVLGLTLNVFDVLHFTGENFFKVYFNIYTGLNTMKLTCVI